MECDNPGVKSAQCSSQTVICLFPGSSACVMRAILTCHLRRKSTGVSANINYDSVSIIESELNPTNHSLHR